MIGAPSWLYYLLGVVMFAVAAYAVTLLATSAPVHQSAGRDVELSHLAMGIAMAGMFVPPWAFGPSWVWELIFAGLLVWFTVRAIQSIQHFGLHVPHTAIHSVMSFAMLLMFWYPAGSSSGGMSMSMAAGQARVDPGLAFLVAFVLFGSAIFTVASPNKGATHFGTHGAGSLTVAAADGREQVESSGAELLGVVRNPSLIDASHVVMCIAMGFMLILMI
jgi:Domain of unknown function (DUF5134)